MIFICSPYTHSDHIVREFRYQTVRKYTYNCMQLGEIVFSPIVYGHEFVNFDERAITSSYWKDFNDHMLSTADSVRVLMLPGWCSSVGVAAEIAYANRLTSAVSYVTNTVLAEEQPQ